MIYREDLFYIRKEDEEENLQIRTYLLTNEGGDSQRKENDHG
jgi:hypothetical protein